MEAALRALDERCRVYQYLVKRRVDAFIAPTCPEPIAQEAASRRTAYLNERRSELCRLDLFMVLVYEPPGRPRVSTSLSNLRRDPRQAMRGWLSTPHALRVVETEIDAAMAALAHKAERVRGPTCRLRCSAAVPPRDIPSAPAARELRRQCGRRGDDQPTRRSRGLLHGRFGRGVPSRPPRGRPAGGQGAVDEGGPEPDARPCPWRTVRDPGRVHRLPGVAANAFDRMRRDIQTRRRHFFNSASRIVNYITPGEARPEDMLVDESASATVRQLGDALTEIEVNGHVFGDCSLTLVLHDEDLGLLEHQAAEAAKVLAVHDGAFIDETYNLLNAWLSIVPGNCAHNLRRLPILETHAADLSFLFTLDHGARQLRASGGTGGGPRDAAPHAIRLSPAC